MSIDLRPVRRTACGRFTLVACALAAGAAAESAGVPAPYMLAALMVGMAAALSGRVTTALPRYAYRSSQALAGVLMGSHISLAALRGVAPSLLPFVVVTAMTVVLSLGAAFVLWRAGPIDLVTAILGTVPGGSSAMLAAADGVGADARVVAVAQYFRVGVIAVTTPPVLALVAPGTSSGTSAGGPPSPAVSHLVSGADQVAGLIALVAVALLGIRAGTRLRLPAPLVLGPMLTAALANLGGAAHGFAPAGLLQDLVFVGIGLEIGLRFDRPSLRYAGRAMGHLAAVTLVTCLACALLAWPLARVTRLSFADAYLATTPGGINAVLPAAIAAHANVTLVSSVQSLRLFGVVVAAPLLVRCVAAMRRPVPAEAGATPE
jgi:uncharacterized protein